jgi:hypothetical protein
MVVMKPLVLPSETRHEIPSIHAATDRLWEVSDLGGLAGSLGAGGRKSGVMLSWNAEMMTKLQYLVVCLVIVVAYVLLTSDSIRPSDKRDLAVFLVIGGILLERAAHRWLSK